MIDAVTKAKLKGFADVIRLSVSYAAYGKREVTQKNFGNNVLSSRKFRVALNVPIEDSRASLR